MILYSLPMKRCVYCGEEAITNKDHVPPKEFLRQPYPPNLLTVRSCLGCNNGASRDEEYFRLMIFLYCHTQEADELFDGPISASMDLDKHKEDLMFDSLGVVDGAPVARMDEDRINRVAEKIARGLQHKVLGKTYSPEQTFEVDFFEVDDEASEVTTFGPDFTYKAPDRDSTCWEFTFYNSLRFVVKEA